MNSYFTQQPEFLHEQNEQNYNIKQEENSDDYFYNNSCSSNSAIGINNNNCNQRYDFNNFEQNFLKCGEIYINNGKLLFYCISCQQNFLNTFDEFYEHFQQFHFEQYNYVDTQQNLSNNLLEAPNILTASESIPCNNFLQNDEPIVPKIENIEFDENNSADNQLSIDPTVIKQEVAFKDDSLEVNLPLYEKKSNNPRRNLASIGQRQFSCDICGKSFILKHHLTYHMTTHDKKPYTCDICNEKFLIKHLYLSHKRNHNNGSEIKTTILGKKPQLDYQCCVCSKNCLNADLLMEHLNQHTTGSESAQNDNDLFANEWNTNLGNSNNNNNNNNGDNKNRCYRKVRTSTDRPFCCKLCGVGFKMKHHLKNHEERHKNYWN